MRRPHTNWPAKAQPVAVVDIDEAKANDVAAEIRGTGAQAIALGGDLADERRSRGRRWKTAVAEFGRVDVLHNNAGADRQQLPVPRHHGLGNPIDVWRR